MPSVYNAACINAEPPSLQRPLVEAVVMADRGYRVHGRRNVFGQGGKPSQGQIGEISEEALFTVWTHPNRGEMSRLQGAS